MLTDFFYLLKEYGVPVSFKYVMDFQEGLKKGLVTDMGTLFTFTRLAFVKRVEHQDYFERAFAKFFYGIDIPAAAKRGSSLLETEQFKSWLQKEIVAGSINSKWSLSDQELMRRFWETLSKQLEEHHGGGKWIGTGGYSPFGHSGSSERGIRVYGESSHQSAFAVIAERRFADYAGSATLRAENMRQALDSLKDMTPSGSSTEIDLEETVYRTAKSGGELELILEKELRDRIKVLLFLDSGGNSMAPYLPLTRRLFARIKDRFKDLKVYHFHNCIYGNVLSEEMLSLPYMQQRVHQTAAILRGADLATRVLIVGDARMAPEELLSTVERRPGNLLYEPETGIVWLRRLADRFKYCVWLNPVSKEKWYGNSSIEIVRAVFHMEELTLNGIKNAIEYFRTRKS